MNFRDVINVIDLEQKVTVFVDVSEVYSGKLEDMAAGQLLLTEDNQVEQLATENGLVIRLIREAK